MVEQKPVSVNWQTLFCILPLVWIYAFYRIEKLRMGIVLAIVTIAASVTVSMLLPFPYGLVANWAVSIGIPIYFIRKWSGEWNERVSHSS